MKRGYFIWYNVRCNQKNLQVEFKYAYYFKKLRLRSNNGTG